MAAGRTRGRGRRAALIAMVLSLVLAGCTYADREPGLFDRDATRTTSPPIRVSTPPRSPLPATNPALPVVGEAVWTSADGWNVQVRIAVHALRRVDGGTVLDWSVTPLQAPNVFPGDVVPEGFDLGLSHSGGEIPAVVLVDTRARRVYRPLSAANATVCLCTPIALAQRTVRIGVTTLLQTAYPELPTGVRALDVSVSTVPQFSRVPVTPIGEAPAASGPTNLTRAAPTTGPSKSSEMFRFGAGEQVFRLRVHRVIASTSFTSVDWAIVSVTGGAGVESASTPPFAAPDALTTMGRNPVAASGPSLRLGGRILRPRVITDDGEDGGECLCTDLRDWPSVLRRPDKVASVVTNYPVLPPGTRRVEVVFEGHPPFEVSLTPAPDARQLIAGSVPVTRRVWRFDPLDPPTGWETADWPTPVPERQQIAEYTTTVDGLAR